MSLRAERGDGGLQVQVQRRAEELGDWIDGVVERERNRSGGDDAGLGVGW
jgi:hypothetical protein